MVFFSRINQCKQLYWPYSNSSLMTKMVADENSYPNLCVHLRIDKEIKYTQYYFLCN